MASKVARTRTTGVRPGVPPAQPSHLSPAIAFYCFLIPNLLAAIWAPIQDCDEVFNFWEPTHYLAHGFGLQTWEWSPEYAVRSWFYVGLHALFVGAARFAPALTKINEFLLLRSALAIVCAACETRLFSAISYTLNPRVAVMFMFAMVFSPGMFHASVAYLPSSFALYGVMLGTAAFMDWRGGLKTAQGIVWFSVAGFVGWPFALALAIPFLVEEAALAFVTDSGISAAVQRFSKGVAGSLAVLGIQIVVDSFFFQKPAIVPFNIVWYNVFGGQGKGPDIFGTEPWHFYIRNLLLNFNIWFLLALASIPLHLLQMAISEKPPPPRSRLRPLVFLTPFYLWLFIFSMQPHKEERFMYPAYAALAVNAATSLHTILLAFGSTSPRSWVGRIPGGIKLAVVGVVLLASVAAGVLRTLGVATAYGAPLSVLRILHDTHIKDSSATICYGKEWYRYPSSFFLPDKMRVKFIKSEFAGLLPGEFSEETTDYGIRPTSEVPSGMNDKNIEDMEKYIDISQCTYLVDSYFPGSPSTALEPNHVLFTDLWEQVACERFLDTSKTGTLARLLWLPNIDIFPQRFRRHWGEYCLLRRKAKGKGSK